MSAYTAALVQEEEFRPMRPHTDRDHPNAIKLKQAHDAFKAGNLDALFDLMRPDVKWHMPGKNALSGTYVGREEIMRNFALLQQNVDAYWAHALDYFGSDDHVALVAQVRARRGNKTLDVQECMLWHVDSDGKLAECWHMACDHLAWDEFFDGSPGTEPGKP
jgi:ketosteroid isomerase-like protein